MSKVKLIFDCPEADADLYYATKFLAPDDVLYLEHKEKRYCILSDLEFDRGKKEAEVDKIFSLAELALRAKKRGCFGSVGVITTLLKELRIQTVTVPQRTSFHLVDGLRKNGIQVIAGEIPFYPQRLIKTAQEKTEMAHSQKTTFQAIALAEKILKASTIKKNFLYWRGKILTSERLRFEMDCFLLSKGFRTPFATIIACDAQGCDPHERGSGVLKAHKAIIVDCFPRSDKSRFFGDATRTFCKGRASPELKKQFETVKKAKAIAISMIHAGMNGKNIYKKVCDFFISQGFETKMINGYKEGFIHGIGHGIGLDIHEAPVRISGIDFKLEEGQAVTVEPGLYYRKTGGVRLEDIVIVAKKGCTMLPTYRQKLEIL